MPKYELRHDRKDLPNYTEDKINTKLRGLPKKKVNNKKKPKICDTKPKDASSNEKPKDASSITAGFEQESPSSKSNTESNSVPRLRKSPNQSHNQKVREKLEIKAKTSPKKIQRPVTENAKKCESLTMVNPEKNKKKSPKNQILVKDSPKKLQRPVKENPEKDETRTKKDPEKNKQKSPKVVPEFEIPILTEQKLQERADDWEMLFKKYSIEETEEDGINPEDWAEEEPAFNAFIFNAENEAEEDLLIEGAELIAMPQNALALLPEQQYEQLVSQFDPGYVDSMVELFKKKKHEAKKLNLPYWDGFHFERLVEEEKVVNEKFLTPTISRELSSVQKRRDHSVATSHGSDHSFARPTWHPRKRRSRSADTPKRLRPQMNQYSLSLPQSIQTIVDKSTGTILLTVHERTFDIQYQQKDISGIMPLIYDASIRQAAKPEQSTSKKPADPKKNAPRPEKPEKNSTSKPSKPENKATSKPATSQKKPSSRPATSQKKVKKPNKTDKVSSSSDSDDFFVPRMEKLTIVE